MTINTSSISFMAGPKTDVQTTDTAGGGTNNEVQVVTLTNATAGEFRLAFAGQTTAPIAYNATASTVDTALEALQAIDTVTVTGNTGGPWTVTFTASHANVNVAQLQGDAANSSSGTVNRTLIFSYNVGSELTSASDSDGSLAFTYDNIGRVLSETQTITGFTPSVLLTSAYDAASNRTSLATTLGSNADFKNTYVFDNLNRMTRVTQASNGGNTVATKRVDFAYNVVGQFTTIDRYQNTGGTNIVAQTTFAYDTLNRLTDLDHKQSSTTLAGYDYTYDRMNRFLTITSTVEGLSTFTHDKTSQLTAGDHASGGAPDETYTYNANGSRTMSGYTTTTNNLTTSDGTYNYEYDDEGNRTKKTTISGGAYEEYTWDHRNRLTKVTFKTSGGTVTKTVEHQYDIANRWTRRHTDPDGPGATAARDNFFAYDGIEPILQFDGTADSDLIDRYLWGPAVDQILADEHVTSLGSAGNIIWPLTDHLGTARDLADQNESTYTTTVTNHRTYNAYGKLTAETNSAVDSDPSYTGKITDGDTILQNNLHRWYDAVLGQWPSEDPIQFRALDSSIRRYSWNSPTEFIDPSGLSFTNRMWGAAKAVGGAFQVVGGTVVAVVGAVNSNPVGIVGAVVAFKGVDNIQAGVRQIDTGEEVNTATREVLGKWPDMIIDLIPLPGNGPSAGFKYATVGSSAITKANVLTKTGQLGQIANVGQETSQLGGLLAAIGKIAPGDGESDSSASDIDHSQISTGNSKPFNLKSQLAMEEARAGAGTTIISAAKIADPRFAGGSWEKLEHIHRAPDGTNYVVHYMKNIVTGQIVDVKLVTP